MSLVSSIKALISLLANLFKNDRNTCELFVNLPAVNKNTR